MLKVTTFEKRTYVSDRDGLNERRQQIDHDDETHGEAAETTQLIQEEQLSQVVHRRVNPTPTLREQNLPVVRSNRVGVGVPNELCLVVREVLEQQRSQVTIFTKVQQVLHV